MDREFSESDSQTCQESGTDQSLVGKIKKNVSEIISNTPLSKWFRKQDYTPVSTVRRREENSDEEDDFYELQPSAKRPKLPPTKETLSLNMSDVLSPINSTNNKQKTVYTFPEPIAGPSGYETRKVIASTSISNDSVIKNFKGLSDNLFKNSKASISIEPINKEGNSDSEESTSGYSSGRPGSKVVSHESSKQTSPLQTSPRKSRSLFQDSSSSRLFGPENSISPNKNSSLSSRMPSFDPSTFGSKSFVDRTLSSKKILNSPFYNGHTIYGGASAYGRQTKRLPQDLQKVLRKSVNIKPANSGLEKGNMQLGKTARRILDTLEQYTSPINDAKKIPVGSKRAKIDGSLTKYIGTNPYMIRESRVVPNKELHVSLSSDSLKAKLDQQKSKLQESTEIVRQIAATSNSVLNQEYQMPVQKENEKHVTKMKTKITSIRQKKVQIEETVPEVNLIPISFPIKELPKFDFVVPPPKQATVISTKSKNNELAEREFLIKNLEYNKSKQESTKIPVTQSSTVINTQTSSKGDAKYEFSAPLILAEYLKPLKALNNFKFSEPLIKKRRSIHAELDIQETNLQEANRKNNGENTLAPEISDTDNLLEKFKPKGDTWECSLCLIPNKADKLKCIACESPKPLKKITSDLVLCSQSNFKITETTWECPTCMIRNKQDLLKCAACEEKKPDKLTDSKGFQSTDASWKRVECQVNNKQLTSTCQSCQKPKPLDGTVFKPSLPVLSTFGEKFAPPANTWECPTCMIRNKYELAKCAACEFPKPLKEQGSKNNFGLDFKKKDGEWECQICMVKNQMDMDKCQCCEAVNPSVDKASESVNSSESKVSTFNFGIDKNTVTEFSFGVPLTTDANLNPSNTNASLVFGEKRQNSSGGNTGPLPTFTFGIPPNDKKELEPKKDTLETNEKTEPKAEEIKVSNQIKLEASSSIKSAPTFGFDATPQQIQLSEKLIPSFTFGAKSSESIPTKATSTLNFDSANKSGTATQTTIRPSFSFIKKNEQEQQKSFLPTLSFGTSSKKSDCEVEKITSTPTVTFSSLNKTDNKTEDNKTNEGEIKVNPLLRPSEKLPEQASIAPVGFSFGLPKALSKPSPKSSELSNIDQSVTKRSKPSANEAESQAKMPMFNFQSSTSTNGEASKDPLLFNKPTEENKLASAGFCFTLGAKSSVPAITVANSTTVLPATFGNATVSQVDSSKSNMSFKFGSSEAATNQTNGFNFGSVVSSFGSSATNAAESKPFAFQPSALASQSSAPAGFEVSKQGLFTFGGGSGTDNKPAAAFSFNAPNNESKMTSPFGSSFGAVAPKTQQLSFGFGSTQAPTFSFGSNEKLDSGFGLGTTTGSFGTSNNNQPQSVFGSKPAQNSSVNGTFNFGSSSTNNQKAGFNFSGPSTNSECTMQGGFNFGPTGTATSGGFSFSDATPSFNANAKPSFNFTGGSAIATFSAPPAQDGAVSQRKIKKAFRRGVR